MGLLDLKVFREVDDFVKTGADNGEEEDFGLEAVPEGAHVIGTLPETLQNWFRAMRRREAKMRSLRQQIDNAHVDGDECRELHDKLDKIMKGARGYADTFWPTVRDEMDIEVNGIGIYEGFVIVEEPPSEEEDLDGPLMFVSMSLPRRPTSESTGEQSEP